MSRSLVKCLVFLFSLSAINPAECASPSSSKLRKLLQLSPEAPECGWNEARQLCDLSRDYSLSLLDSVPDSELKITVERTVVCFYIDDIESCKADDHCHWAEETKKCRPTSDHNDRVHFEDCIGKPVAFLEFANLSKVCKNLDLNAFSCNRSTNCSWDQSKDECIFDIWKFFTSVTSEGLQQPAPRGLDQLLSVRLDALREALKTEDVERDEIRSWEVPSFQCPVGVDLALCSIAEMGDSLAVAQLYCEAGLVGSTCAPDASCSESCDASDALVLRTRQTQTEAYLHLVENPVAATILGRHIRCLELAESDCAESQDCTWDAATPLCEASTSFVLRTLTAAPLNDNNRDCDRVRPIIIFGCLAKKKTECTESLGCFWDTDMDMCSTTPGGLLQGLMMKIPGTEATMDKTKKYTDYCGSIEDAENCT